MKETVEFKDLNAICRIGIIGGVVYMAITAVAFTVGFIIGFTGAI